MKFLSLIFLLFLFVSCQPQEAARKSTSESNSSNDDSETPTNTLNEPTFPLTQNFLQEGSTQTASVVNIPTNFSDSLLIRGLELHTVLKSLTANTKLCVVAKFPGAPSSKIAVMSAKIQSYNNLSQHTVEHYLRIQPNNSTVNQSDCSTQVGMLAMLSTAYATTSPSTSINSLCSACTTSQQSDGFKIYTYDGNALTNIHIDNLKIQLQPTNTYTGLQCTSSSTCNAQGYSCCLNNQCVQDGSVKNGVNQSDSEFLSAQEDVLNNPTRFTIYPQFYYVCQSSTPTDPDPQTNDPENPYYTAQEQVRGLRDLYECLNPQFDEISYCPKTHTNASVQIGTAGATFTTSSDDQNFTSTSSITPGSTRGNNIYEIRYGGDILYKENVTSLANTDGTLGTSKNDDLSTAQNVFIKKQISTNAVDDNLIIKYKINGSCEKVSTSLARCSRTYIQGQTTTGGKPSDHTGQTFKISEFINPNYTILVKLDASVVADTEYTGGYVSSNVSGQNSVYAITFNNTTTVYAGQKVYIQYYVTSNVSGLTTSRVTAQNTINTYCGCAAGAKCNLSPMESEVNGVLQVTNYECFYPQPPQPELPLQQTFYLSSKTVPYIYHDSNGVAYNYDTFMAAPAQDTALAKFSYTNQNPLKPSNATTNYTGFNEIYGSFDKSTVQPKPPKVIEVIKDRNYDIYVDEGTFSSCVNCGNDYYNPIQRIFPQLFGIKGAGYQPDLTSTNRSTSTGKYRADDLLFGRACFVPATMIPWSHAANSNVNDQRRMRLATQHFLFANGYNRDWFGFDYGSVIGSFDGVTWFSIGNSRHIKAKSNRLYIATNSYFGDITVESNFKISVNESAAVANAGSQVTHDTMSLGAECQKSHYCTTDNDCIRQLGFDYTCQNITGIKSLWPEMDLSGNEKIVSNDYKYLTTLIGGTNGQSKRCIYRGRGAPCEIAQINSTSDTDYFAQTSNKALAMCSPNHYCADVTTASTFNKKIARYAKSPTAQNLDGTPTITDTYGLSARVIGRPFKYYGTDALPTNAETGNLTGTISTVAAQLSAGSVAGLCVPGKNPDSNLVTNYGTLHTTAPSAANSADKLLGIGVPRSMASLTPAKMYMSCPIIDSNGNYFNYADSTTVFQTSTSFLEGALTNSSDAALTRERASIQQNISTALLDFYDGNNSNVTDKPGVLDYNATSVTSAQYHKNACLRTAGSACFSDMECAPSSTIANKMKILPDWGTYDSNEAEKAFWTEELICGNANPKFLDDGVTVYSGYNILENKCCRDNSLEIKVFTQTYNSSSEPLNCDFSNTSGEVAIPGITISSTDQYRNIKNHIIADKVSCLPDNATSNVEYPALIKPTGADAASYGIEINHILKQYKTLDLMNSRTCCSKNWIRHFDADNGSGHKWGSGRNQIFEKDDFKVLNWFPNDSLLSPSQQIDVNEDGGGFTCDLDSYGSAGCEIRNFSPPEIDRYLSWFGRFELIGIPQVLIPSAKSAGGAGVGVMRMSNDWTLIGADLQSGQDFLTTDYWPIKNTIPPMVGEATPTAGTPWVLITDLIKPDIISGSSNYISAGNTSKIAMHTNTTFTGDKKRIFSENEFSCCLPAGQEVSRNTTGDMCCSGLVTNEGKGPGMAGKMMCCLDNFADVTVYLNRYVSSEGNGLPDSAYEPETGYIKDPAQVCSITISKNLCCSGRAVRGRIIANLPIPINGTQSMTGPNSTSIRFGHITELDGRALDRFNNGMSWNNHIYCIPENTTPMPPLCNVVDPY